MCQLCGDPLHFSYEDSLLLEGEAAQNFAGAWTAGDAGAPLDLNLPSYTAEQVLAMGRDVIDRSAAVGDGDAVGGVGDQGSSGLTSLLTQFSSGGHFFFSGNKNVDAVLIGSQWNSGIYQSFFYSFYSSAAQYGAGYDIDAQVAGTQAITGFSQFNAAQQAGARYAMALISGYTNANFTEVAGGSYADFRFGNSTYPGSAFANFPSSLAQAGDMWFNLSQPFYSTAGIGNWGLATIMHELGHSLGLKHGHDDYTALNLQSYLTSPGARFGSQAIDSNLDGQPYSLMTYRGAIGSPISFQGDGFNQPQTYMALDIAALQYMYGADFSSSQANAGDSVYEFSTATGQMFINGVGQGQPTGNVVFRTVWDGGGNDTYYLANYSTPMDLDLNPGGWMVFDYDAAGGFLQRANNQPLSGGPVYAPGNVANAYLYQGNTASLIENVVSGTANDFITSNVKANNVNGNVGNDWISYRLSTAGVIVDLGADLSWDGSVNDVLLNIESALGSDHNDTFYAVKGEQNNINGWNGGGDTVTFIGFNSYVFIDLFNGVIGDGTVNDYVVNVENAIGTAFNDFLIGNNAANNVLNGGTAGADYFDGFAGIDTLDYSSNGRGVIVDMTSQISWDGLYLDTFNRMEDVKGSVFADQFYNDSGASGNWFTGNGGNDTYRFGWGRTAGDRILDFNAGDSIIFSGYGAGSLSFVSGNTFQVNRQGGGTEQFVISGYSSVAQLAGQYSFI